MQVAGDSRILPPHFSFDCCAFIVWQRLCSVTFNTGGRVLYAFQTSRLIREVRLHCNNQPWVYARSVLPATSLVGRLDRLRTLDNRPLGHLLFTDPHMSRDRYEICRVPAAALGESVTEQDDDGLWGRRSRFVLSGHPIMVSEIFLPAFRPW